jgi:hypothetical protein
MQTPLDGFDAIGLASVCRPGNTLPLAGNDGLSVTIRGRCAAETDFRGGALLQQTRSHSVVSARNAKCLGQHSKV